jgi:hypothetical protein
LGTLSASLFLAHAFDAYRAGSWLSAEGDH